FRNVKKEICFDLAQRFIRHTLSLSFRRRLATEGTDRGHRHHGRVQGRRNRWAHPNAMASPVKLFWSCCSLRIFYSLGPSGLTRGTQNGGSCDTTAFLELRKRLYFFFMALDH